MSLEDKTQTHVALRSGTKSPEPRVSLIIYYRDGTDVVPLPPGQKRVIGRRPPSDVVINEPSLSRQHASFWLEGDEIWVEDLGSTNGTHVNGQRIERSVITPGDEVTVGPLHVCTHLFGPMDRHHRICGHDQFLVDLEDELMRCQTYRRRLSLLAVRAFRRTDGGLSRWCPRVQQLLRPFDRVGLFSLEEIEIAVPEVTREEVLTLALAITGAAEPADPALVCGVGSFPEAAASAHELISVTRNALQRATSDHPVQEAVTPEAESDGHPPDEGQEMVACSPAMQGVLSTIQRLAGSSIPVLIIGETGTGKEVVAHAIHASSGLRERPMRCINCGAIPSQLIESVLFGHERGAFTGALRQAKGVFEQADGGTVLLDEIGELSPAAQAALLRVIETKRVTRIGSDKEIAVNVRVLAATNRDLEQMCELGTFRSDLLFRLNTMMLTIPPLRERVEDIEPLAMHFVRMANEANGCSVRGLSAEALTLMKSYSWPGNVRELRNVVERGVVLAQRGRITAEDLSERVRAARASLPKALAGGQPVAGIGRLSTDVGGLRESTKKVRRPHQDTIEIEPGDRQGLRRRVQDFERNLIVSALCATGWNHAQAARDLNMPLRTLFYKVNAYGIDKTDEPTEGVPPQVSPTGGGSFKERVEQHEARLIREALEQAGGDQQRAAAALDVTVRTLNNRIRALSIMPDAPENL